MAQITKNIVIYESNVLLLLFRDGFVPEVLGVHASVHASVERFLHKFMYVVYGIFWFQHKVHGFDAVEMDEQHYSRCIKKGDQEHYSGDGRKDTFLFWHLYTTIQKSQKLKRI
jgi:hypothetical protein